MQQDETANGKTGDLDQAPSPIIKEETRSVDSGRHEDDAPTETQDSKPVDTNTNVALVDPAPQVVKEDGTAPPP